MTPIRFPTLYQDRHAFVLGLGDSGLAMAAWAARLGARVTVWDSREQPPQLAALRERLPEAAFVHGEFTPELLASIDHSWVLLKSPGLSPLDARLKPLLVRAEEIGLRLRGELELFAQALAELKTLYRYEPGVLAITGTNGKTTTTSMTALLVERAGRRVAMAGNIGPTLLGTLSDALDKEPMPQPKEVEIEAVVDLAVEAVSAAPGSAAAEVPNAEALLAPVDAPAEERSTKSTLASAPCSKRRPMCRATRQPMRRSKRQSMRQSMRRSRRRRKRPSRRWPRRPRPTSAARSRPWPSCSTSSRCRSSRRRPSRRNSRCCRRSGCWSCRASSSTA